MSHPLDPDKFDPDLFLAWTTRWADLTDGDPGKAPADYLEALDYVRDAYNVLAEHRRLGDALRVLADVYAQVVTEAVTADTD